MVQMLCLDWAGLGWGLLDYYSRDTASSVERRQLTYKNTSLGNY